MLPSLPNLLLKAVMSPRHSRPRSLPSPRHPSAAQRSAPVDVAVEHHLPKHAQLRRLVLRA